MTDLAAPLAVTPRREPRWAPRTLINLLEDQLAGIDAFHQDRRAAEAAATASGISREAKLDACRHLDVVRRQHEALLSAAAASLRSAAAALPALAPRVLLVHRNEWFLQRLADELATQHLTVIATVHNGAESVGITAAEQPDLVLAEDVLPQVTGMQLVETARRYAPRTMLALQVPYDDALATALDAGAAAAFTRRIPPAVIAEELARLLRPAERLSRTAR